MNIEELKKAKMVLHIRVEDYGGSDAQKWEVRVSEWGWNPVTKTFNGQGHVIHPRFSKKRRAQSIAHALKTFYKLEGYFVLTDKQLEMLIKKGR